MQSQGKRVTIYINNTDHWRHQPLYLAILELKHIKRFPVVDEQGKLLGLVGRSALLSALVEDPQKGD